MTLPFISDVCRKVFTQNSVNIDPQLSMASNIFNIKDVFLEKRIKLKLNKGINRCSTKHLFAGFLPRKTVSSH